MSSFCSPPDVWCFFESNTSLRLPTDPSRGDFLPVRKNSARWTARRSADAHFTVSTAAAINFFHSSAVKVVFPAGLGGDARTGDRATPRLLTWHLDKYLLPILTMSSFVKPPGVWCFLPAKTSFFVPTVPFCEDLFFGQGDDAGEEEGDDAGEAEGDTAGEAEGDTAGDSRGFRASPRLLT